MRTLLRISSFIGLAVLSLAIFQGCEKEDIVETDLVLQPYFQLFADEAAKRGIVVDYEAERIEGLLQPIRSPDILGQCFRNEEKPRKVVIDTQVWEESDEARKRFLIYHELGHCFLNRGHRDDRLDGKCLSIMHSNTQLCPDFRLTEDNTEEYLDELFGE